MNTTPLDKQLEQVKMKRDLSQEEITQDEIEDADAVNDLFNFVDADAESVELDDLSPPTSPKNSPTLSVSSPLLRFHETNITRARFSHPLIIYTLLDFDREPDYLDTRDEARVDRYFSDFEDRARVQEMWRKMCQDRRKYFFCYIPK
jgi:hypothetical protein